MYAHQHQYTLMAWAILASFLGPNKPGNEARAIPTKAIPTKGDTY